MVDPGELTDAGSRVFAELNRRVTGVDGFVAPDVVTATGSDGPVRRR